MVMSLQERARGAFIGLAVGDALGSPTEGKTPEKIFAQWGRVTDFLSDDQGGSDDTEYALFSARLLLELRMPLTSKEIEKAHREHIINSFNSYKGAGFSEIIAIHNLTKGLHPPESGQHVHSWSDGLAMRVTPYGIVSVGNPAMAAELARADGVVTNAGEGIYSGQAVAAALSIAMTGASLQKIVQSALDVVPKDSWTHSSITRGVKIGNDSQDVWDSLVHLRKAVVCSYYFWPDVAPEVVGLAFGIIAAARGKFENAVLGAVNIGRDTDTIAAIAGAVCGAAQGVQSIPERWRQRISVSRGTCINAVKGMAIESTADGLALLAKSWSAAS